MLFPNQSVNTPLRYLIGVAAATVTTVGVGAIVGPSPQRGSRPLPLADGGARYLFVLGQTGISVIDLSTLSVVGSIPGLPQLLFTMAMNLTGTRLYVAAQEDDGTPATFVVDTLSRAITRRIPISGIPNDFPPKSIAVHPNESCLYLGWPYSLPGRVTVTDISTGKIISSLSGTAVISATPQSLCVNGSGTRLYVIGNDYISMFNTANNLHIRLIKTEGRSFVVTSNDQLAVGGKSVLTVFDETHLDPVSAMRTIVGADARSAAILSNGMRIITANADSNDVSVIDRAARTVISISVGIRPVFVTADLRTDRAYVVNQLSNSISIVDVSTETLISSFRCGTSEPYIAALSG